MPRNTIPSTEPTSPPTEPTSPGAPSSNGRHARRRLATASIADLVAEAAAGDQRAWDAIVERYSGLVWSIARACGLRPADAAEVSQTTWLRLVQNLSAIRDPERLGSWLSMTARREAWRIHRQSSRMFPVETTDLLDPGEAAADEVDRGILDAERQDALKEAFRTLSPRCQSVLRLLMNDPAPSYLEVAAALDMPVGSIGPTRGRCLDCLRERAAELRRG